MSRVTSRTAALLDRTPQLPGRDAVCEVGTAGTTGYVLESCKAYVQMGEAMNLFISHQWRYPDQYRRLVALLREQPGFRFWDFSVPFEKGIDATRRPEVQAYLRKRLNMADVLLVVGNPSAEGSAWIDDEIAIAKEIALPILAIRNYLGRRIPDPIWNAADDVASWVGADIADRARRLVGR